jgi:hypothetical protein
MSLEIDPEVTAADNDVEVGTDVSVKKEFEFEIKGSTVVITNVFVDSEKGAYISSNLPQLKEAIQSGDLSLIQSLWDKLMGKK